MKKIIAIIVLMMGFIFVANRTMFETNNNYLLQTVVISVSDDIVTVIDNNGNLWEFEGAESWEVGDECICTMNNNNTNIITDDIIIEVK